MVRAMTDPAGSDRIQQDVPTASGTGDNGDSGTDSFADVPLTADEAIERDRASGGDQPARSSGQPELADRGENSLDS
jgi:hypothetical protein